jgi:hypothetical protein
MTNASLTEDAINAQPATEEDHEEGGGERRSTILGTI